MKNTDAKYHVIIAGSGLGGLLCGTILAREGFHVCILEKNRQFGGCLQTFSRKGSVFDTGVHYFGGMDHGQILNRYWNYFGLTGSVKLERMNSEGFDVIGIGDKDYPMAMGFDHFVERLLSFFPSEKKTLENYVALLKEVSATFPLYNIELPGKHDEERFRNSGALQFFSTLSESPLLNSVLAGNNLLYCGQPGHVPLHLPALINHSFISSAWRTVGGSDQIAKRLADQIRADGGEIFTEEEIIEVALDNEEFKVITKQGHHFSSKKFISDIHPAKTLEMMDRDLFRKSFAARIKGLNNTPSSFALYLVLKDKTVPYFDHNYYFHKTRDVWNQENSSNWPHSYMMHTPAPAMEGGFAKNMIILTSMSYEMVRPWTITRHGERPGDYLDFKAHCTDLLLNMAEQRFPGIKSSIEYIEVSTPLTWRDYTGTPDGSLYGIEHDFTDPVMTTIFPATKLRDFFFTGQNTNIHGVLGVTIGAVLTCGEIIGLDYLLNKIRNT